MTSSNIQEPEVTSPASEANHLLTQLLAKMIDHEDYHVHTTKGPRYTEFMKL